MNKRQRKKQLKKRRAAMLAEGYHSFWQGALEGGWLNAERQITPIPIRYKSKAYEATRTEYWLSQMMHTDLSKLKSQL